MPQPKAFILGALLLASAAPAFAQAITARYTPQQIVYTGAPDYKPGDLNAIVGLQPNKSYSTADVDPGLQRLADTGLFLDIRYTISDVALTFTLTPQPDKNMLPALYSNFVMFAPGDLTALVHAKVPLFTGKIPAAGNLQQSVQDALTNILHEKGFPTATVDSIASNIGAIDFTISNPPVQVRAVQVEGVAPEAQAKVAEIQKASAGLPYERGSELAVQHRLEDAFHDLAYLDAAIDTPTRSAPVVETTRIVVDLATTAHEGAQYHVSKIDYPVTDIVKPADFEEVSKLKPGDLAGRLSVLGTGARITGQFKRHGYRDARVFVTPTKDTTAHTVAYAYTATPGERYHLKSVKAANLDKQQQIDFDENFKLKPGDPYDEGYITEFLHSNKTVLSFRGLSASYKAIEYPDTHLIDLTITFTTGAPPK